jgi:hypothetical protein
VDPQLPRGSEEAAGTYWFRIFRLNISTNIGKVRTMADGNLFEMHFQGFVRHFGGRVLEEAPTGKTADFLFSAYNVIAELKTMTEDKTKEINEKVSRIVDEWSQENKRTPTGFTEGDKYIIEMKGAEPSIAEKWLNLLRQAVDRQIKDANAQVSDTKQRETLPSARGIILISNPSNRYHSDPRSYRLIIADVLGKRDEKGGLRYPHIHGAVYFSCNDVKSVRENMYFWANLQMRQTPDEDVSDIVRFQNDLQQGWYQYIEKTTGIPVRQHSDE